MPLLSWYCLCPAPGQFELMGAGANPYHMILADSFKPPRHFDSRTCVVSFLTAYSVINARLPPDYWPLLYFSGHAYASFSPRSIPVAFHGRDAWHQQQLPHLWSFLPGLSASLFFYKAFLHNGFCLDRNLSPIVIILSLISSPHHSSMKSCELFRFGVVQYLWRGPLILTSLPQIPHYTTAW